MFFKYEGKLGVREGRGEYDDEGFFGYWRDYSRIFCWEGGVKLGYCFFFFSWVWVIERYK